MIIAAFKGNSPGIPLTEGQNVRRGVFFIVTLYKLSNKQSISRWFEMPWRSFDYQIEYPVCKVAVMIFVFAAQFFFFSLKEVGPNTSQTKSNKCLVCLYKTYLVSKQGRLG